MATTDVNEVISAPPAVVFAFIARPDRHPLWQQDLDSDAIVSGDGSVGSVGRESRRFMGRTVVTDYEVTEYVEAQRWGFRTVHGPVISEGTFTCAPADDDPAGATVVSLRMRFAGWSGEAMARFARKQFATHLRALKELVEREGELAEREGAGVR